MKLKLLREQTGESWTLKPNREYVIGRSQDCDIVFADAVSVGDRHLKLSFDPTANAWYACDLGSSNGTYINDRRITNCTLATQTRIGLAGVVFFVATPLFDNPTVIQQQTTSPANSWTAPTQAASFSPYPSSAPRPFPAPRYSPTSELDPNKPDRRLIRKYFECLRERNNLRSEERPFFADAIADFLDSIREKRMPEKGLYIYIFISLLVVELIVQNVALGIVLALAAIVFFTYKTSSWPIPPELPVREEIIQQWLYHDKQELIDSGKKELKLIENDGQGGDNIIDSEPIVLMSGIKKELGESEFLDWAKFIKKIGIEDYFCEKGVDRLDKYSIYNFITVFPCQNFIAYYLCKWNFIRGISLDDETCEYLYDSIVSVKSMEFSSSNVTATNIKKEIHFEVIKITATDHQEVTFPVFDDARMVRESDRKKYDSIARNATHNIRQQVRQRKPGRMTVESLNEKMQRILDLDD